MFKHVHKLLLYAPQNSFWHQHCRFSTLGSSFKEVTIPVPWGHIAGKWWGDPSVQPILGLHGWEDNAATFDTLAPMLTVPSFLAFDMMGHGMSSYYPMGCTHYFNAAVLLIRRIINYYKWQNVSFIGHSFGSAAAFLYSAIFPDEVDKYVGIDCARSLMMPINNFMEDMHNTLSKTLEVEERMNSDPPGYSYDDLVNRYYEGSYKSPTHESSFQFFFVLSKWYLSRDPRVKLRWLGRMPEEFVMACAPRIKCKILSIRGKQGFLRFGDKREEVFLESLRLLKNCEHHDVEGSHHLHLNNPENVAPLINKKEIREVVLKLLHFVACKSFSRSMQSQPQLHCHNKLNTFQEVTIPVPWGHVAGKWWGDTNMDPVLGIHGWQNNAGTFDNLAPLLEIPSFLAIDLFGHGKSSHYPMGVIYSHNDAAMLIRRLVNYYKWKNISFIGHSMGSTVAFLYSALHPEQVDKFVSIDCGRSWRLIRNETVVNNMRISMDSLLAIERKMGCTTSCYTYDELLNRYYEKFLKQPTLNSCRVLLKRELKKALHDDSKFFLSSDHRLKEWSYPGWTSEFLNTCASEITCKVLSIRCLQGVIIGDSEKPYFDSLTLLKYYEHHEIEGNHFVHLNNPESIAPLINKFFKSTFQEMLCRVQKFLSRKKYLLQYQCRLMETSQEVKIPVPWGYLAGKWWGDTNLQPVLGIHGWQDNSGTFDKLAPLLNLPSFLAIDLPGHGYSSHYPLGNMYYFVDLPIIIRRIVKHYKMKKPSFIGHSLGSSVCFLYSAMYPDEVDKFVSIDCVRSNLAEKYKKALHSLEIGEALGKILSLEHKLHTPPCYTYDELLDLCYKGLDEAATLESCAVLMKRGVKQSSQDQRKFYFSRDPKVKLWFLGSMTGEQIVSYASKIKCRVLSIRYRQGFIFGDEIEKLYFDSVCQLKNCKFLEMDGTHYGHLNNPDRVAPLINSFFDER
ncbi:hypothetical protein C0J52_03377 [Blattella germanica]|nr:hypothetical protein C0J52_03377 [Blattella germanica]